MSLDERHERLSKRSIPKKDLIDGVYYIGRCRNATVARWDANKEAFVYTRKKFEYEFDEEIKHPEDDNGFDLFYPFELFRQ